MTEAQPIEVVLGAGGGRGFGHIGFLMYLQDMRVRVGNILGVSIGALVAAMFTNGYAPEEIETAMRGHLSERTCGTGLELLFPASPRLRGKMLSFGLLDLVPLMRHLVDEYDLKPQPNLRVVAFNIDSRKPVIFQGRDYDLAIALAASCSVPGATRPVRYRGMRLQDGGLYHTTPADLCASTCIVSSLDRVRQFPRYPLSPLALIAHLFELRNSWKIRKEPPYTLAPHFFVIVGSADVGTGTFKVPRRVCDRMVHKGYTVAQQVLQPLIENGAVPVQPITSS